jgi:uncharacterized protein YcfJ
MSGCMNPYGRPDYTASGALAGGATGAIIGSMARHPGSGALLGGAVGAVIGGLIGHGMDQAQEAQLRAQAPQTLERVRQGRPLALEDIKALARAGISDDVIISQIRNTGTVYHLSAADIIDLNRAGVSERVIRYMIDTASQEQTAQVAPAMTPPPPAPLPEFIPVMPAPGYMWISGAWFWGPNHWVWRPGYWHRPMRYHYRYRHWHHR